MPIKKTGITLPAGVEIIRDLKYYNLISSTLVGKDLKGLDLTMITSLMPRGDFSKYLTTNQWRRNPITIQGASWINNSAQAKNNAVSYAYDPAGEITTWDYYYFMNYGQEKPYFESTKGTTAGRTFFFDKSELYELAVNGVITRLTNPAFSLSSFNGSAQYENPFNRIYYEDDSFFYLVMMTHSNTSFGMATDKLYGYYKISKADFNVTSHSEPNTTYIYGIPVQLFENATVILFVQAARGRHDAGTQQWIFTVFTKATGAITQQIVNAAGKVTETTGRFINTVNYSKPVLDAANNRYTTYYPYEAHATGLLQINMLKIKADMTVNTDITATPETVTCTLNNVPTQLLRNVYLNQTSVGTPTSPVLNYGLVPFSAGGNKYMALSISFNKDPVDGFTWQKLITFKIDPVDPTILTYVSHYELPNDNCQGVLPSADGLSFLMVGDSKFFLLNWNEGAKSHVASRVISTPSVIKRAAYDSQNQIWINTNNDYTNNSVNDNLEIFYPTGSKYVKMTPTGDTTLEFAGTPINTSFKLSVYDLTGARLAQNITLEVLGGTFVGGVTTITVLTSATDDVTVQLTITAPGSVQIVASNF